MRKWMKEKREHDARITTTRIKRTYITRRRTTEHGTPKVVRYGIIWYSNNSRYYYYNIKKLFNYYILFIIYFF